MEDKSLKTLINEAEKISQIEKCRTCQCFYDMLLEFKGVLKNKPEEEVAERLQDIIRKSDATHNCLGCDPCYPVPLSNILSEMTGNPATTCGPVCKPAPIKLMKLTPSWPIEPGEYIVGTKTVPVVISTLASDDMVETIANKIGSERFAIIAKTHNQRRKWARYTLSITALTER